MALDPTSTAAFMNPPTLAKPAANGASGPTTPAPKPAPEPKAAPVAEPEEAAAEVEEPKKPEPRKWKHVVDGQEEEWDEAKVLEEAPRLLRSHQMEKAAAKRFQEAAALRKEAEEVISLLKSDPESALARLGLDVDGLAEQRVLRKIEREKMSPEQRKALERDRELQEREAKIRAREEEQAAAAERQALEHYEQEFDKVWTPALEKSSLPKTPQVVYRMAELTQLNLTRGIQLEPDQVAEMVADELRGNALAAFKGMTGPQILKNLPPEVRKAIREAELAEVKGAPRPAPKPKPFKDEAPASGPKRFGEADWKARMSKILSGG